ncbi:hypothetical protein NLM31_09060 [Bradyrhizobium sp. CCGUVB4N]|uniref:hypothetical protein n=1 Tax=Bradyrhizobium sp. CCGUVB4N TaxID=2949631 RepID=UPI0020B270F0|nr:hypothetical protein [Bradyrhizobium sp. CCGUVB4N]MCP3380503.1 hypothetical protein [Bradyrhizobium sp. CCGUVB4N]
MERANNNFNLFDFDVEGFARAYGQQPQADQRSGDTVQGFEERLGALQLSSSRENSAEASSPDARPGGSGAIRGGDIGGSMRMPRQAGSAFRSTRRSVDIPCALPREWIEEQPQSDLRDDRFGSARYIPLSDSESPTQAERSKKRGLWSRIKSEVGKAFGGRRSEKSSSFQAQHDILSTNIRVDHAKQPARIRGVFVEDDALLNEFESQAAGLSAGTIRNARADIRNFSAWLNENGREQIAYRLGNPALEPGLDRDLEAYANARHINRRRTDAALKKLRDAKAGKAVTTASFRLVPYAVDATLIDMWGAAEKRAHRVEPETVNRRAGRLSRLSDWLQTRERRAMADRLFTQGLAQDVKEYRQQTGDRKIDADLLRLQRYQQVIDGNRALGISLPEDAPGNTVRQPSPPQDPLAMPATPSGGAWDFWREVMQQPASPLATQVRGPQPSPDQDLPAMPETPSEGAWGVWREFIQEPASSSSAARMPSDVYGDLEPLVNLNPPTPYELYDDAHSTPALGGARPPSFVGPSVLQQEVGDIGPIIGEGWRHGSQPASDVVIDILHNIDRLPNQFGPRQVEIQGELYSVTLGPGGRNDVRLIHHPRASQIDEAAPSVRATGQSLRPVPDLGYLIRGGWQHRERLLPNYLARALEGEGLMPAVGRPTYVNIHGVPYRAELVQTDSGERVRIHPELG